MPDKAQRALNVLEQRLDRQLATYMEVCGRCGLCAESCHYYVADPVPEHMSVYRSDQLRRVYRRHHDWLGRILPGWVGARDMDDEMLDRLRQAAFGTCTMCNRCTLNCTMGMDMGQVIRTARGMLVAAGLTPSGLQDTVEMHLQTGNSMGVSREDLLETLEWMEEEVRAETGDPQVKIPVDKAGAQIMYTFNPREPKFYPLTIAAAAKIFHAAGEDWTVSSHHWDVTNYAFFSGDDEAARIFCRALAEEARRLSVSTLVMCECGHGYRAMRWESERWLGEKFPFEVISFVELMADYIRQGRIRLDPAVNTELVTYHDPCNQVRNGGVIEEPRYILQHAVTHFAEMTPNREQNYCCGGGGGMLAMSEFRDQRLRAGKVKADQIKATGARIVATSCHNCIDQLNELNRHYQLGVKVKNLSELVADALILEAESR